MIAVAITTIAVMIAVWTFATGTIVPPIVVRTSTTIAIVLPARAIASSGGTTTTCRTRAIQDVRHVVGTTSVSLVFVIGRSCCIAWLSCIVAIYSCQGSSASSLRRSPLGRSRPCLGLTWTVVLEAVGVKFWLLRVECASI